MLSQPFWRAAKQPGSWEMHSSFIQLLSFGFPGCKMRTPSSKGITQGVGEGVGGHTSLCEPHRSCSQVKGDYYYLGLIESRHT